MPYEAGQISDRKFHDLKIKKKLKIKFCNSYNKFCRLKTQAFNVEKWE